MNMTPPRPSPTGAGAGTYQQSKGLGLSLQHIEPKHAAQTTLHKRAAASVTNATLPQGAAEEFASAMYSAAQRVAQRVMPCRGARVRVSHMAGRGGACALHVAQGTHRGVHRAGCCWCHGRKRGRRGACREVPKVVLLQRITCGMTDPGLNKLVLTQLGCA